MSEFALMKARYFKHPTNQVSGVHWYREVPSTEKKVDQGGSDNPGREATLKTKSRAMIEIYGSNYAAMLSLIGATAANGVVGYADQNGANRKTTFKNVYFVEPIPPIQARPRDAGGKITLFGVRGICLGGTTDTWATMRVDASDAA